MSEPAEPIPAAYDLPAPNGSLLLYQGAAKFRGHEGAAKVELRLAPQPRITFEFEDHGETPWLIGFMGDDEAGEEPLHLTGLDHDMGVDVFTTGTGILSGRAGVRGTVLGSDVGGLRRVVFHVLNFRIGLHAGMPLMSGESIWIGRREFTGAGWRATLDDRREVTSAASEMKEVGGYAFTHVGCLEREDGSDFSADDAQEALWAIQGVLSFARAAWAAPMLPVGYAATGEPVRWEWGVRHVSEWHEPLNWLDQRRAEGFAPVAGAFFERWFGDDCWQQTLWRAVGFYVGANGGGGREVSFIESRIILAQAGVELLAWVLLDDGCNQPVGEEKRPPKVDAGERIRQLLERAGIPTDIPAGMTELAAFATTVSATNAPEAVTRLRNLLVHPRRKAGLYGAPSDTLIEAWRCIVWWLELLILSELDYNGAYASRLIEKRWVGTVEPVPWAACE